MSYNYEEISHNEAKDLLRKWREGSERRSEEVMELWSAVLREDHFYTFVNKLGNEKHVVLEQIIYAALDCHQYNVINACITVLSKEFPGSLRVMRHKAAILEAQEKYTEALAVLDNIIASDPTNSAARKRRVATLKAQGKLTLAIQVLVDYLKKFICDVEAWQELCSLYLRCGEYSRAVYCAEELLLHAPHNHLHAQRVADIRYTMGGLENLELAKTYYCQALKLNPDNMRAVLGLFLTTNNLLSHYKSGSNSSKRAEAWKLCRWSQSKASQPREGADLPLSQMMLALSVAD